MLGRTCFTESLLLDHFEELFVSYPPNIHNCYGVWQDGFQDMEDVGVQFYQGITETEYLKAGFPKGGLLLLDDLMAEGSEDKGFLDFLTKDSHQNITVLYLCQNMFPPGKYAKSISKNAHHIIAFKNPGDQLGMRIYRLDYQPFCEPAFLAPHHGWITGLPIVFLDQSQRSLLKSSRLPCDWSILSLVYPTWRISVRMIFLFLESVC